MFNKNVFFSLFVVCLVFGLGMSVQAHTYLDESHPANGSTIQEPLTQIDLEFDSNVQNVNQLELIDEAGYEIEIEGIDHESEWVYVHLLEPLVSGYYTVYWDIISADGHITNGEFSFEVQWEPEEEQKEQEASPPEEEEEGPAPNEGNEHESGTPEQEESTQSEMNHDDTQGEANSFFIYVLIGLLFGFLLLFIKRKRKGKVS